MAIRVPDQRNRLGGYAALDDRLLVLDFQAGNPQAFVEIHHRYGPLVRRVCQRFLPNAQDVEEAFQETMIRVYQGLYRFNGRYALQPWVARIAKNVSLDILRGRARRPQNDDRAPVVEDLPGSDDEAERIVERLVQHDTVLAVLTDLPDTHRRALMLRELDGRSHREIAQEMEISTSQAKALIHRAKVSFRKRWLEKVAERGGFLGIVSLPLLWLVRLGDVLRRIGERAGQAAQAAQAAAPEAMTSTVAASAAPAASPLGERLVAAGMTVLLAGGVTVGAAKIVTDRADERADRAAVTAPTPVVTKHRVERPSDDARVPSEDPRFGEDEIKAEPPIVVVASPSPVAGPSPEPASVAVTCSTSGAPPNQILNVTLAIGGTITLSEASGTITVNPDGGDADCFGNLVADFSTVEVNGASGNESVSIDGAGAGIENVTVDAGGGDDIVNGGTYGGVLVANGEAGADTLSGGAGADTLNPGTGDDDDTVNCGTGTDTVSYAGSAGALTISLAITGAQSTGAGSDTITNCENLTGGSGDDKLTGSTGDNTIDGLGGNDTLEGGDGIDILNGDDGNDTLRGEAGDDTINGGAGTDTASYSTTSEGVAVSLAISTAQDTVGAGNDTIANTENLTGGDGADILTGSARDNVISGGPGNDSVIGNAGVDTASLGQGDDMFVWDPGDGSDVVKGGSGSDTMVFNGSSGNEVMAATASGGRVLFTRNLANIVMQLNDVEGIYVRTLAGSDTVTVNDVRGTDLGRVEVDLASALGGSDGQADTVTVVGTSGVDSIAANANGTAVEVGGLAAIIGITNADPALDMLVIDTGGRADDVTVAPALAGLILVSVL